jgi:hypothetical protein
MLPHLRLWTPYPQPDSASLINAHVLHLRLHNFLSASFHIDILDKGKGETMYDRRNGCALLRE